VTGTTQLEFIPIKSAGRYRADPTAAAGGNPLDFNSAADTFDVLNQGGVDVANGDFIVIYNLGVAPADAYDTVAANSSRRQATAPFGTGLAVTGFTGGVFPFSSPAKRFQVVGTPAAYACSGGVLTRYWNYAYGSAITSGSSAPIVQNVTGCRFTYQAGVTALNGLVTMELSIALSGESVDLVNQVHINNVP
jgi:MSHA biogenesis protein MshO